MGAGTVPFILLNDTLANTSSGPVRFPGGETINDPTLVAPIQAAGGILWPANDVTVAAAAAIAQKYKASKGQNEDFITRMMVAAAAYTMALGDTVVNLPLAALAAGTDLAETPNGYIPATQGGDVVSAVIVPSAALTASATVFLTLSVFNRVGATQTLVAQATTNLTANGGTGNWTAWVPVPIPLVGTPRVAPNSAMTFSITHASTGTAFPVSALIVNVN